VSALPCLAFFSFPCLHSFQFICRFAFFIFIDDVVVIVPLNCDEKANGNNYICPKNNQNVSVLVLCTLLTTGACKTIARGRRDPRFVFEL
jgi:hypothetical protein